MARAANKKGSEDLVSFEEVIDELVDEVRRTHVEHEAQLSDVVMV